MIRNIVFDMGNVLLFYEPKPYIAREISDPEAGRLLFDACFGGSEWKQLDAGTITEEEALASMQTHVPPELRGDLARLFAGWPLCRGWRRLSLRFRKRGSAAWCSPMPACGFRFWWNAFLFCAALRSALCPPTTIC